jgi:hypothetical protein
MLTNLIENRGREFSNLLKIGDYLARSLRENVELFNVDNGKVTYLTESGGVVAANYSFKPYLKLSNIQVDDSSILENEEAFNKVTNSKVSVMLADLIESDYQNAETSFDDILSLFETKLSFDRIKARLTEKSQRFGEQTKIISSPEFAKVFELKDKLIDFLKENKSVADIPEIKNGLKLASIVSKAFNLPRITLNGLKEAKTFTVKVLENNSIYEHICKQELIAKELLEAKQNFDTTWANNQLISELASLIYEKKRSKIEEKVAEIIGNIPYFALSTKKQLSTVIENSLSVAEMDIPNKDITSFVSTIFEMKKPVKNYIIKLLNEKYGINVNNLNEIPTFSNLLKTEMVILASLAKLAPKNSLLKDTLYNLAESLKVKNGAESIDLVNFLNEVFSRAGYKSLINETSLMQYLDFSRVADDLSKIGTILKLIQPALGGMGGGMAGGAGGGMPAPMAGGLPGMGAGAATPPLTKPLPGNEEEMGLDTPPELDQEGSPVDGPMGDAEEAAAGAQMEDPTMGGLGAEEVPPEGAEGGIPGQEGGIPGEEGGDPLANPMLDPMAQEEPQDPVSHVSGDDITNMVASIEDLLASIKSEVGGGEPGMEEPMDGDGELPPEESIPGEEGGIPGQEGREEGNEGDFDNDGEVEGGEEGKPEKPEKKESKPDQKKKPPKFGK